MKSFAQKREELAKLTDKLGKAKITVFTTFSRQGEKGLGVKEISELKRALRGAGAEYMVGKKTLTERAMRAKYKNVDIAAFTPDGSLGLAFGYVDEQTAAKSLYNFARKHPALKLFSALWNGQVMDDESFVEFAKLPGRETLIGRLLGLMNYPLSALANVTKQVAEKK